MRLPNADRAVVDPPKVRDYLLAAAHPVGRFKARFFVSLGYAAEQWERLRDDILILGHAGDVLSETTTAYGRLDHLGDRPRSEVSGLSAPKRTFHVW